jgi:hypothetical protein
MATMIRVSPQTHEQIQKLAKARNEPAGKIVTDAVELLDREQFWAEVQQAYDRLRSDPDEWNAYLAESDEWDVALLDGLEDEPPYFAPGEE